MIRPLPLLGLVAIYVLMLPSSDPLDLVWGLLVGLAVLVYLRRFHADGPPLGRMTPRRALHVPVFAWGVLREVAEGTVLVLGVVLGLIRRHQGIIAVPLGERSEVGVAATAFALNLSPGEIMLDVDWDERVMWVHVLDASDPEAVRRRYARFYERYQRGLFP